MKLPYIDALRGIAVCGVMLVHTSHIGFPVSSSFSWVITNGALGVQLFYLVSAFTLFLSMTNRQGELKRTRNFFLRRFFRIAPLFYVALGYYLLQDGHGWNPTEWDDQETGAFFSSLLFLHGISPAWINYLVPGGWSIAVEMMFYLLVPFLFLWANNSRRILLLLVITWGMAVLSGIGAGWLKGTEQEYMSLWLPNQLAVFMLGILAFHHLYRKRQPIRWYLLASVILLTGDILIPGIRLFPDHLIASFCFFLVVIFLGSKAMRHLRYPGIRYLGTISYSCYLVHFAVIYFLNQLNWQNPIRDLTEDPLFNFGARYIIIAGISMIISSFTYRMIERPGIRAGRRLIQRWSA